MQPLLGPGRNWRRVIIVRFLKNWSAAVAHMVEHLIVHSKVNGLNPATAWHREILAKKCFLESLVSSNSLGDRALDYQLKGQWL